MTFSADSSFIVRLYSPFTSQSELQPITKYLLDGDKTVRITELGRVEVLNVLLRMPTAEPGEKFEHDLRQKSRLRLEPVDWTKTFQTAESLARRFSRKLKPGGHDLMLVAAAVTIGATWFLSYDRESNQRALAASAGLKVWPALDKDEKGLVRPATE